MDSYFISDLTCSTHLPPPAQPPLAGLHAPFADSKPFINSLLASPRASSAIHTTTFLNLLHVLSAHRRATSTLREVKRDQARVGHGRVGPTLLLTLLALPAALASVGDRSPAYQRCLAACSSRCPPLEPRLLGPVWSCPATCSYSCLTGLTELALATAPDDWSLSQAGGRLDGLYPGRQVQFHGKWPFVSYLSMQEPLSVLFSLSNLYAHWLGLRQLRSLRPRRPDAVAARRSYLLYALSGLNCWLWSCVFHTRDIGWTEKADYFGAAGGMVVGLWAVGARLLGASGKGLLGGVWAGLCALGFVAHCVYLASGDRFNYDYNMKFNVAIALAQIFLWAGWATYHSCRPPPSRRGLSGAGREGRAPHRFAPLLPLILLPALTSLELLDFAPVPARWRLLDAHALWHLSTVPVVRMWYAFLVKDVRWLETGEVEGDVGGRDRGD